ncbi:transporter family ABC domain protein (macronuclear) [Tetrahymena thermophila SB210]|uniref:Transporter family ABC domain protein n=1 Tax=Tetrahymena thermophila (strain SB210) TaxID=312017 RepID=W7XBZ7_TETTS|nr:transporter family ABC domain protein [Tetrahymena thermophila SB210]EWS74862.1 transporter family ABC domain protein [Tetrahymena thermophila SB210]|eukprot:XP_012652575.1 transporter family ABC domain protein [Tetrahymena thermophila SB210]
MLDQNQNIQLIDITFQNLTVNVQTKNGQKQLLKNISGICKNSEITAILGSSGAGKTTLLNALCKRIQNTQTTQVSGSIQANQEHITFEAFSNYGSYIMQDDILLETMTVKECLNFAANLKLQGSQQEKSQIVQETLKYLKLERCQNTLIGGQFVKGISGGERKRTSIGFELVTNPTVLILDEPTSGLDSFTAYLLISLLKRYAQNKRKTVIFTIHTPSSDIWSIFDRIMLLVDGRFIYQGASNEKIISHFNSFGFVCPKLQNPADYFLSIMNASENNLKNFPKYFEGYEKLNDIVQNEIEQKQIQMILSSKYQTPIYYQIIQIAKRSWKNVKRNPILFKIRIIQAIFMAIFLGLVYVKIEDGSNQPSSIRDMNNRSGLLYFTCVNQLMMALNPCLLTFPSMSTIFLREQNSKLYSVLSYFIGRLLIEIIPQIIAPIIFGIIQFYMIGLNDHTSENVIFYLFSLVLCSLLGFGLGQIGGTLFNQSKTAIAINPLILYPNMLFGGFLKYSNDLSPWISWISYLFPTKYTFNAMAMNEYEFTYFTPNPTQFLGLEFTKCFLKLFK